MGQIRHGCATTTHAIRAAIQRSSATNAHDRGSRARPNQRVSCMGRKPKLTPHQRRETLHRAGQAPSRDIAAQCPDGQVDAEPSQALLNRWRSPAPRGKFQRAHTRRTPQRDYVPKHDPCAHCHQFLGGRLQRGTPPFGTWIRDAQCVRPAPVHRNRQRHCAI
jgi:hypothetical protein